MATSERDWPEIIDKLGPAGLVALFAALVLGLAKNESAFGYSGFEISLGIFGLAIFAYVALDWKFKD